MDGQFTDTFVNNQVFISEFSEITFGRDQAFINYPCVFPVVCVPLCDTKGLCDIADKIRAEVGITSDALYDFYICINGMGPSVDNCITFTPWNGTEDEGCEYHIDLDEAEQIIMFNKLDSLLKENIGKGCMALLREAWEKTESED